MTKKGEGLQSPFRLHKVDPPPGLSQLELQIFELLAPRIVILNPPHEDKKDQEQTEEEKE